MSHRGIIAYPTGSLRPVGYIPCEYVLNGVQYPTGCAPVANNPDQDGLGISFSTFHRHVDLSTSGTAVFIVIFCDSVAYNVGSSPR